MANRAYLVGSEDYKTAGPTEEGIEYDPDKEILCGASYHIPIFWLSLFEGLHLAVHKVEDCEIPTLVAETKRCQELVQQRRGLMLDTFAGCESHWQAWEQLIAEAPFKYLKLDGTEIWDLQPDTFGIQLSGAVKWFSSRSKDDFAQLLEISGIPTRKAASRPGILGYDVSTKTFTVPGNDSVEHHLHGYAWVRKVPWKDK